MAFAPLYCWIQRANNLARIFISVSMRTLGPCQLQLSFSVSFPGFGVRVTGHKGWVGKCSFFFRLKDAALRWDFFFSDSHSQWSHWGPGSSWWEDFFFFLLLIRPDFLMIWKKIFTFSFHLDSALVICATLGIFPFYLSYLTCQHKVVRNSVLKSPCFLHSWWCFLFFLPNLVIFPFSPCSA